MRHHPSKHLSHLAPLAALLLLLSLLPLALSLPVSAAQSRMGRADRVEHRIAEDGERLGEDLIDRGRDILDDMPLPDANDGDTSDDHDGNIANDPGDNKNDGIAKDDIAPNGADDGASDPSHELSREPMDTTPTDGAGILPWIIGALVVLAIVLVALALIPNKRRSR